jgi:DNA (cytosine-5)-methyltransferase 1
MPMPLALDLFCGAGGATRGLQMAGFEVVGIDHKCQPRYCGDHFIQADALRPPVRLEDFDLIWASPPCQAFTAYKRRPGHVAAHPNLIPQTRAILLASGAPYVIENIPGAPLELPFMLCGSSFGLNVRRHRLFETSRAIALTPPCAHGWQRPRFQQATNRTTPRRTVEVGVYRIPLSVQRAAMGIDWMKLDELSEAIPPAYSEFIARSYLAMRKAV